MEDCQILHFAVYDTAIYDIDIYAFFPSIFPVFQK